ncbi:MAG: hydrogen peroxide-inducible genes activator [Luteibaculum sp.]
MTLIQLEYAIAVHDMKSFSKASEKCFVTQPTLSMQIQKLEEELDVVLFDRKKKPLKTTEIGELIIEQARNVISTGKGIKDVVAQYKKQVHGELKVGIIPTVSPYLLPLFLPQFLSENPDLKIQIEERTTEEIVKALQEDHLDVGILATPLKNPRITEYPIYAEGMFFYVSPNHPLFVRKEIDVNSIDRKDVWLLNHGHCFRNQVLNLCEHLRENESGIFAFESGSLETIVKIIDGHNGITILPESALYSLTEKQKKNVRPISTRGKAPGREISLVVSRTYLKQSLIKLLGDKIQSSIPEQLKQNQLRIIEIDD